MKSSLVAALVALMAMPVISIPTPSDAQVLTGRNRASAPRRPARPAPPPLSEAEEDRLWDAQAEIVEIDRQVTELQTLGQSQNGMTAEQQAAMDAHVARRAVLQADVTRLEAKRDR
ncbi:MAG: hypothetical protein K2Y04_06285 [Caulobacteraceae bacterium]|nr:hypothetical protein [Caulobacteraceae bacterium]